MWPAEKILAKTGHGPCLCFQKGEGYVTKSSRVCHHFGGAVDYLWIPLCPDNGNAQYTGAVSPHVFDLADCADRDHAVSGCAKDHDAESGVHWKEIAVPLVAFAAIVVYAVLFDLFGYFPATAVMLVGFMIALKVKPWWLILAIRAGYALFIYLLFVVWLKVSII